MTRPVRLQLSRRKGFDLQARSREVNGLEAVNCARPGRYGSPFRVGQTTVTGYFAESRGRLTAEEAVARYEAAWRATLRSAEMPPRHPPMPFGRPLYLGPLSGHNLACWCRLCARHAATGKPLDEPCPDCAPCHADVLLELANRPICEAAAK